MAYKIPLHSEQIKVAFPQEHVMLLTFNRPEALNAMTPAMESDIDNLINWFDNEPNLWVAIVTGQGGTFCAGADLIAWKARAHSDASPEDDLRGVAESVNGFGSLSRRSSSAKPIIAAVNGSAYGGGVEIILNCDLVVASEEAVLALPEVKRGVVAIMGVIPRLAKVAGHQLASEMLLLGRNVPAKEAASRFGFVNKVVPKDQVLQEALKWAAEISKNSPDAVQSTKRALLLTNQLGGVEDVVVAHTQSKEMLRVYKGGNLKEGLRAFAEKRKPTWKNPARL